MDDIAFSGVVFTPLKRIAHPKGDVLRGLKRGEESFEDFGEAYFTYILSGETKGWKKHTRMLMNLIVPVGLVRFDIWNEQAGIGIAFTIGESNYGRLTVPSGFWMAFSGVSSIPSLILNLASLEHDPDEAVNADLGSFPLTE